MKEGHLVGAKAGIWFKTSHLLAIIHSHGKCQEILELRADFRNNNHLLESAHGVGGVLPVHFMGYLRLPQVCMMKLREKPHHCFSNESSSIFKPRLRTNPASCKEVDYQSCWVCARARKITSTVTISCCEFNLLRVDDFSCKIILWSPLFLEHDNNLPMFFIHYRTS